MRASTLLVSYLLAGLAAAVPSAQRRESHIARHSSSFTRSIFRNDTFTVDSPTWAGAVIDAPKGTFKSVSASFTVPTPQEQAGWNGWYAASAWVGLGGESCARLQAGADFHVESRDVWYNTWYEGPTGKVYLEGAMPVRAGDVLYVNVTAQSTTSSVFTITNANAGKTFTTELASREALCMEEAQWIVEAFGAPYVPLANFSQVTFTSVKAITADGGVQGLANTSFLFNMQELPDEPLTSVAIDGDSLIVSYIGPVFRLPAWATGR